MRRQGAWFSPELGLLVALAVLACAWVWHSGRSLEASAQRASWWAAVAQQRLTVQSATAALNELAASDAASREALRGETLVRWKAVQTGFQALRDGGSLDGPAGAAPLLLKAPGIGEGLRSRLASAETAWQRVTRPLLAQIDQGKTLDEAKLLAARNQMRAAQGEIDAGLRGLAAAIEGEQTELRAGQALWSWAGLVLALLLLAALARQALLRLSRQRSTSVESEEILQTVPAGLFLLDRQARLGHQYSAQLEKILQKRDLAGADFFKLLSAMVASETLVTARDYVNLLLGERVNEHLVASLNPLDEVAVQLPGESGRVETRWLGFAFKRVLAEGRLKHLLVTVTDVSDRVLLARKLEQAEAASDQQAERLLDLFVNLTHVEQGLLEVRMERWERLLREANEVLRRQADSQEQFHQLINQVFRPIHALKGEAAAVDLQVIVQRAQAVERELAELRTREAGLSGNDFLPVTVRLEDLFSQFDLVRKVTRRLAQLAQAPRAHPVAVPASGTAPVPPPVPRVSWDMARDLCRRAAESVGKQAQLQLEGIHDAAVPEALRQPLLDVLLQLVRNAIAHGIESPAERQRQGKPAVGQLRAQFTRSRDGGYAFVFRDDGRGIDFDGIRKRAIASGKFGSEIAGRLQPRQLAGLIFEPGFSTAELPGDTAGRGVGLDLVRDRARGMGGQIGVSTAPGQYTQFTLRVPAVAAAA